MALDSNKPPPHNDGGLGKSNGASSSFSEQADDPLAYLSSVFNVGKDWRVQNTQADWHRGYRSFRNQHFEGSKYLSPRFKGRSKIFRPKTRTAVFKNLALVRQALFSTVSPLTMEAENDDNQFARAGASVLESLTNIYLDRASTYCGCPWYLIAMGSRQTSDITGVAISKQFWRYVYEDGEPIEQDILDEDGNPTGEVEEIPGDPIVKRDHPDCELCPPESVVMDPGANWLDPIQTSQYFSVEWPWNKQDLMNEIETGKSGHGARWNPEAIKFINQGVARDSSTVATRRERSGGTDRFAGSGSANSETIVCRENFVRIGGVDWHFWSIGTEHYLTSPIPVEEAYPEQKGRRPYVMGYGAIEAFSLFPWSQVAGLQQLQQELNDIANARLDAMREAVTPTVKVKRGKRVDLRQIENRYPGSVLMVDEMEDTDWDNPPDVARSAYQETNLLGNDFDDAAGLFNTGTVATNRQLNETVGGMQLMSGAANTLSEFFLSVWIETWVEPVLRQIVNCVAYYVADPRIIALAGKKAKTFQKFQQAVITEEMLTADVTLRVNAGIGTQDPMMKMQKFAGAVDILGKIFGEGARAAASVEDCVTEIFGSAGYRDGERFIDIDTLTAMQKKYLDSIMNPQPQEQTKPSGPSPDELQAKAQTETQIANIKAQTDVQVANIKAENDFKIKAMELRASSANAQMENDEESGEMVNGEPSQEQQFQLVMMQSIQQIGQGLQMLAQGLQEIKEAQNQPKRVVYRQDGTVDGIVPFREGAMS